MSADDPAARAQQLASYRLLLAGRLGDAGLPPERQAACAPAIIAAAQAVPGYYPHGLHALIQHLCTPYGDMLEHTIAGGLASGALAPADVVRIDLAMLAEPPDKRKVGTSQLYAKLRLNGMAADAARAAAAQIERGIYNQAIYICTFRDITTRSWDNPGFVGIYSGRVSTIALYLDPGSSVCREYGPLLYRRMCGEGERLALAAVGQMSEADLCPAAFKLERDEITLRSEQKVEERTSALWPCPVCHARAATYREVQDRSSDEPASIYCTCTVCSHNYKPC